MKPFLSFFLWDFAGVFYSIETLYKIFCWNFSSKCVRGKVILQSQGKEFFTWHGKDFFT